MVVGNKLKAGEIIHLFNTSVRRIARSASFFPAVNKCSSYLCVIVHMHLPLLFVSVHAPYMHENVHEYAELKRHCAN